jgi:hypothetical protein
MSTIAKAATTAKAAKAYYEIILVENKDGHYVPKMPAKKMKLGKTVHYSSNEGKVTIKFHAHQSPFLNRNGNEKLQVTSKEPPIKLSKKGEFSFDCLITPFGIKPNYIPDSYPGGNMVVR